MPYFPDAFLKLSKANGQNKKIWRENKNEIFSELSEMARKLFTNIVLQKKCQSGSGRYGAVPWEAVKQLEKADLERHTENV